jgi:hypothetical protein
MPGTYVTDLRHYLDDDGELADMPAEAKQMASFLVLIVDAVTPEAPPIFVETELRCRTTKCTGEILARLDPATEEIQWHCTLCDHHGVIRNWQGTKWDRRGAG